MKLRRTKHKQTINESIEFEGIVRLSGQKETVKFFDSLLCNFAQGFFIYSKESNELYLSEKALKLFKLPQSRIARLDDLISLIASDDQGIFLKAIENANTDEAAKVDFRAQRSEKRDILYIRATISSFVTSLSKEIIYGTFRDRTKNEKLKKELSKIKEKTTEAEKLRNLFLANISHEIRTPMNSIIGYAELLNIGNIDEDKRKEYARIIKTQGDHLLKLIDDIAEVAKYETGELSISKSPCNLNLLLNELKNSFNRYKSEINKDNLEIRVNLPDKTGITVYTDAGRLQQVLSNLLSNALKFTYRGYVEYGYRIIDEKIEFCVKDTGIGITKEEQKFVFNRLRLSEETLVKKFEGSGLGLTISKGIIRLLGGKIWLESEPNKGSTFYFTIPLEEVPEVTHTAIDEVLSQKTYNWRDKVVLIVEDEEVNSRFLEAVLQNTEVQMLHAENGIQAIELCRSINKIDLILMDIKMPGMNGYDATREIRKFNPLIPIIAQTAYTMKDEKDKCMEAGCTDVIAKPIDVEELLDIINKYLA